MAGADNLDDVGSLRFLFSRRWVLLLLTVALLSTLAYALGQWQFHRLDERRARNAVTEQNESAPPVPVTDVLAVGAPVASTDEMRMVTATGTYAPEDTVIVRYRTRKGAAGVDVVVPLVLADGTAVLVDRGWVESDNVGGRPGDVPLPPAGEVTVTGWVRADATGDSTRVTDASTRAVSSAEVGSSIDRSLLGGFLDLRSENPPPVTPLALAEPPDLGNGPHFFYGLQWWFFGLLAVGGFVYLAWDEWRTHRRAPAET